MLELELISGLAKCYTKGDQGASTSIGKVLTHHKRARVPLMDHSVDTTELATSGYT